MAAGVAAAWTAARHLQPTEPKFDAASGERATVRLFRNPVEVPAFTARDLDGRTLASRDWRGKVVVVNFWATWCPPCRAEIPTLIAMQEKYRDHLMILGISEDDVAPDQVKRFTVENRMNFPTVMLTPELERLFPGVGALPTSFVLDREGRLVQKHVGMVAFDTLELETRALAGLPVNASIEQVDRVQPAKLGNAAATTIPGVDLAKLSGERRADALQRLNSEPCTCGCDLTVAKCRIDDPNCGISLPIAKQIVQSIVASR